MPPSRSSGGGVIYLIAVIVLAGAIGAIVYFRLRGGSVETPPPSSARVVPSTPPPPPQNFDPPPPPPPIEEEVNPQADGGVNRIVRGYDPCTGQCTGTASAELQRALSTRGGAARSCYERALRTNASLTGKLVLGVRLDATGGVCSVNIVQDNMHSNEVASCVMGMFRQSRFPAPTGGCVVANVPLSFVPKEGK